MIAGLIQLEETLTPPFATVRWAPRSTCRHRQAGTAGARSMIAPATPRGLRWGSSCWVLSTTTRCWHEVRSAARATGGDLDAATSSELEAEAQRTRRCDGGCAIPCVSRWGMRRGFFPLSFQGLWSCPASLSTRVWLLKCASVIILLPQSLIMLSMASPSSLLRLSAVASLNWQPKQSNLCSKHHWEAWYPNSLFLGLESAPSNSWSPPERLAFSLHHYSSSPVTPSRCSSSSRGMEVPTGSLNTCAFFKRKTTLDLLLN